MDSTALPAIFNNRAEVYDLASHLVTENMVQVEEGDGDDFFNPELAMPRTAYELRRILAFGQAEWVGIEIHRSGALDGSDAGTQKKIKDISSVVKQLMITFPSQLTILRIEKRQSQSIAHDLRPYWDTPSPEARDKVRSSTASFTEFMQTRIEEWTRETAGEGETELVV